VLATYSAILKSILTAVGITLIAFVVDVVVGIVWIRFVMEDIIFSRYWGFLDVSDLVTWLPSILLYGLVGFLFGRSITPENPIKIIILALFILLLELFWVQHHFAPQADMITRVWAGIGYLVPSLATLLGYSVNLVAKEALQDTELPRYALT